MLEAGQALDTFLQNWEDTPEQNKASFMRLRQYLAAKSGVVFDFLPRPGVTYSLRVRHDNQKNRELFVIVDVIEDQPRWLSVCFYEDTIDDAQERGNYVPEGLLGEDAICFDVEDFDEDALKYIEARMDEAHASAARG